jgi:selenocysteine lyase/cysteine desulfurase
VAPLLPRRDRRPEPGGPRISARRVAARRRGPRDRGRALLQHHPLVACLSGGRRAPPRGAGHAIGRARAVEGKQPSDVGKALDADGIPVRLGKLEAEPMLKKLGVDEAVRASFMFYNTREEADALAASLIRITAK